MKLSNNPQVLFHQEVFNKQIDTLIPVPTPPFCLHSKRLNIQTSNTYDIEKGNVNYLYINTTIASVAVSNWPKHVLNFNQ